MNDYETVQRNTHKGYMKTLHEAGIPIVPTVLSSLPFYLFIIICSSHLKFKCLTLYVGVHQQGFTSRTHIRSDCEKRMGGGGIQTCGRYAKKKGRD